jgi:hypothetical protein
MNLANVTLPDPEMGTRNVPGDKLSSAANRPAKYKLRQ